jgi:hypothetical protein
MTIPSTLLNIAPPSTAFLENGAVPFTFHCPIDHFVKPALLSIIAFADFKHTLIRIHARAAGRFLALTKSFQTSNTF